MVKRRKRPSGKKKIPDLLAFPSFVAFLGVIGWIGYDLYNCFMERQQIVREMNQAVEVSEYGEYRRSVFRLLALREQLRARRQLPAEKLLQRWRPFDPDLNRTLATLYRNIGNYHYSRQESIPAIEAFVMSLLHKSTAPNFMPTLAQECFYTKNWELGFIASSRAVEQGSDEALPLLRLFRKRYTGPTYGEAHASGSTDAGTPSSPEILPLADPGALPYATD